MDGLIQLHLILRPGNRILFKSICLGSTISSVDWRFVCPDLMHSQNPGGMSWRRPWAYRDTGLSSCRSYPKRISWQKDSALVRVQDGQILVEYHGSILTGRPSARLYGHMHPHSLARSFTCPNSTPCDSSMKRALWNRIERKDAVKQGLLAKSLVS
jgi:hypothetical protein